jgi:hypothetical protein
VPCLLEAALPHAATIGTKELEKALAALPVGAEYADVVGPSEALSRGIGNSYTAALWANVACLVSAKGAALEGKRVGAFSYGSGAIATMMALRGGAASIPVVHRRAKFRAAPETATRARSTCTQKAGSTEALSGTGAWRATALRMSPTAARPQTVRAARNGAGRGSIIRYSTTAPSAAAA